MRLSPLLSSFVVDSRVKYRVHAILPITMNMDFEVTREKNKYTSLFHSGSFQQQVPKKEFKHPGTRRHFLQTLNRKHTFPKP